MHYIIIFFLLINSINTISAMLAPRFINIPWKPKFPESYEPFLKQQPYCTVFLKDKTKIFNTSKKIDSIATILELLKQSKVIDFMLEDAPTLHPDIDLSWMEEKEFNQLLFYCKKIHTNPEKAPEIEATPATNLEQHQHLINVLEWADRLDISFVLEAGCSHFKKLLATTNPKERDDTACAYEVALAPHLKDYLKGCIYITLLQTNSWLFNNIQPGPMATFSHPTIISSLAFVPHHPFLVLGGNKTLEICNYMAQKQVWIQTIRLENPQAPITTLSFDDHKTNPTFASVLLNNLVFWNAMNGNLLKCFDCNDFPHFNKNKPIVGLSSLFTTNKWRLANGQTLYEIKTTDEKLDYNLIKNSDLEIKSCHSGPDKIIIGTISNKQIIHVNITKNTTIKLTLPSLEHLYWSADAKKLIYSEKSFPNIRIIEFDVKDIKIISTEPLIHENTTLISQFKVSQDGRTLLSIGAQNAYIWDLNTKKNLFTIQHSQYIDQCAISDEGRFIALSSGPHVAIYDTHKPIANRTLADLICMYLKHALK